MNVLLNLTALLVLVSRVYTDLTPPVIVKQPSKEDVLYVSRLPFELNCAASPLIRNYYWNKDGKFFKESDYYKHPWATSETQTFYEFHVHDIGTYQCFAKTSTGVASSHEIDLERPYLSAFEKAALSIHINGTEGKPFNLTCKLPYGRPEPEAVWFITPDSYPSKSNSVINDIRITPDSKGTLWFSYLTQDDASIDFAYRCAAKSPYHIQLGNRFYLNVIKSDLKQFAPNLQYVSRKNEIAQLGKNVKLFCIFSGNPIPTVMWMKDGFAIEYSYRVKQEYSGKILSIKNVNMTHQGIYTCEVSNGIGNAETRSIYLEVVGKPYFIEVPKKAIKNETDSIELRCVATGNPKPHMTQWFYNGKLLDDLSNSRQIVGPNSLIINNLTTIDIGNYGCKVVNSLGSAYSETTIEVKSSPAIITNRDSTLWSRSHKNITIKCTVEGIPRPEITWYHNNTKLDSDKYSLSWNGSILHIQNARFEDAGKYICQAKNKYAVKKGITTIRIEKHTIIVRKPQNLTVTIHSTAVLVCKADSENDYVIQIVWLQNGKVIDFDSQPRFGMIDGSTLVILQTQYDDAGTYTCKAKTSLDEDSAAAILTVL
ncbi:hypothetical protein ILUMI_11058 [Ignelater luminosus]|uniref:Ig-like domain-containing protein n=1 Tax=Ignelater luminosus TaxID=2038154 RepID=A0A8K0D243_IGNLU|nr:hypothetical protein ILUMI_11058 [Ignelater luminosus]